MKTLKYIIALFAGCLLFGSCADEFESPRKGTDVIDGLPVTVSLPYGTGKSIVVTKAGEAEEEKVHDLYVFVFKKDGTFESKHYFDNLDSSSKTVTFHSTSGEKRVFALANVTANNFYSSDATKNLKDQIDAFWNDANNGLDEWLSFAATMVSNDTEWATVEFLMSGRFLNGINDSDESGTCVFAQSGDVLKKDKTPLAEDSKIWLVRTVASVTFKINTAGSRGTFTPESWEVRNLPNAVYLYDDKIPASGNGVPPGGIFNPDVFDGKIQNNSFSFYMLENRQPDGTDPNVDVDSRENPANAPADGTYIILKGRFKGTANNPWTNAEGNATANVTYYVHLGYINGNNPANDYSVKRNHKYTYIVTVNGVDDIVVEAFDDINTDRADGDVFFTDGEPIDVDAHYERRLLYFEAGHHLQGFNCLVNTAKTGWVEKDIDDPSADIDWVYFVEQSIVDDLWNNGGKGPDFTNKNNLEDRGIYTIRDLKKRFNRGDYLTKGVYFYAYINENYDPNDLERSVCFRATDGVARTRTMKIAIMKKGNTSTVSTARYIINQKPIITIYNIPALSSRNSAWGLEWYNENLPANYNLGSLAMKASARIDYGGSVKGSSHTDGRANTLVETNTKYGSMPTNSPDIAMYNNKTNAKAYAACLSRNRDENGDGKITEDEVKWYLPAIDQYQHYWVGANAIPVDATLYPAEFHNRDLNTNNGSRWNYYHYHSSGGHRFWSEEGSAVGLNTDGGHIRCARNLGESTTLLPLATYTTSANSYTLSIDNRLTDVSLRQTAISSKLGLHSEYEPNNKLYKKIEVKKELLGRGSNGAYSASYGATSWRQIADDFRYGNPCASRYGAGWRAPNQRELILITSIIGLKNVSQFSATYFTMWDYNTNKLKMKSPNYQPRIGFRHNGVKEVMELVTPRNDGNDGDDNHSSWPGTGLYLRCVRDL